MYTITILTALLVGTHGNYLNALDGRLKFQCPPGQSISWFHARHDNLAEDREFDFSCEEIPVGNGRAYCSWQANYVNDMDKVVAFSCPLGGYLAGIESIHDNDAEDRRFNFRCCDISSTYYHMTDCTFSGFQNDWDQELDYTVPDGWTAHGVISVHSNIHGMVLGWYH